MLMDARCIPASRISYKTLQSRQKAHIPPCAWGALLCSWLLPVFKLDMSFPDEKNNAASCSNIHSLSINILILAQPSAAPPDCNKTSVWALALKCMNTVTKIGALGKMYRYSPEKKVLMGKCTGTIQTMGPCILKKGCNPDKSTGTVTKMGATMENVPVHSFSLSTKTLAITTVFFLFFSAKSVCTFST
jgi:hypothetical protein